ncbi:MAG: very short patch repair endonuclease [Hyphomonadaceae bacterium]
MADTRTPDQRRRIMQSVGVRDTGPERIVRSALHKAGFRFRLHRRDLPGKPDIVLPAKRLVVFVHGCFWHGHGCAKGKLPKSRLEYWRPKIAANAERDKRNVRDLAKLGWRSLIVWQCETSDTELAEKLRREVIRRS